MLGRRSDEVNTHLSLGVSLVHRSGRRLSEPDTAAAPTGRAGNTPFPQT
jgi:hypothetical protein